MHYLENKHSSSNPSACDAFSHSLNHNVYESSDATQSKGGPRSQHHLLKIIFSVRKLEVVFKFASPGVLRHTLFQGQQLSNSNTFTFSSLMALKCCFTNLLWEINIILYSTFVVWSDYSLCGDYLWRGLSHSSVTGSCTWTGEREEQEISFFYFQQKTFWTYFLMDEYVKSQKEVVSWLFDLVTYSSFNTL